MQLRGDDASDVTPGVSDGNAFDVYMVVRPKNNRGDSVILAVEQVPMPTPLPQHSLFQITYNRMTCSRSRAPARDSEP